jgi:hypothetical protein
MAYFWNMRRKFLVLLFLILFLFSFASFSRSSQNMCATAATRARATRSSNAHSRACIRRRAARPAAAPGGPEGGAARWEPLSQRGDVCVLPTRREFWLGWTFLASIAFLFIMIDVMFFSDKTFVFDPNYKCGSASCRAGRRCRLRAASPAICLLCPGSLRADGLRGICMAFALMAT